MWGSEFVLKVEERSLKFDAYNLVEDGQSIEFIFKKKPIYSFLKRFIDIILSLLLIIVLSPLFVVVMILIVLDDRSGKAIFKQERCGKNGKRFNLYKFRTMCPDAESRLKELQDQNEMDGPVFKIKDDPRITKIGKILRSTNIDELPQLVNILKGDMSFVGPRPPLPKEVEQYDEQDQLRLLVIPGLTCYWQVTKNRNSMSFKEWMKLDRKYILERSLLVDIKLIFKTVLMIFKHDGC